MPTTRNVVFVVLSVKGKIIAQQCAAAIAADNNTSIQLHGYEKRLGSVLSNDIDVLFDNVVQHMQCLFNGGIPIIAVCAAGVVIRALAPVLHNKHREPPVLVIAENGRAVVPLLGGHQGGHALAGVCARALGISAAMTTATDDAFAAMFTAAEQGYKTESLAAIKAVVAGAMAKQNVRLINTTKSLDDPLLAQIHTSARNTMRVAIGNAFTVDSPIPEIGISESPVPQQQGRLVYYPQRYTLGIGCIRGANVESVLALVTETCQQAGIALAAIASINSLDLKANEPALLALAKTLNCPFRFFSRAALNNESGRIATPSHKVHAYVGCPSVCEAAALAAGGAQATLVVPKTSNREATCALAYVPHPITDHQGQARGLLMMVGLGPGALDWRTPEATHCLARADCVVGYGGYMRLLGAIAVGKHCAEFALGQEVERCSYAIETASTGKNVALVCSGDAGVYGMAALVFELLEKAQKDTHSLHDFAGKTDIVVCPGLSALHAAAARAGALLGHDFCAISLSDLLTPRDAILNRVHAAAQADFVIAFYNPASTKRQTLLGECCAILLQHRPPDTPVVFAKNLGRGPEQTQHTTLSTMHNVAADMLTIVLIGASNSRCFSHAGGTYAYTPRGYTAQ